MTDAHAPRHGAAVALLAAAVAYPMAVLLRPAAEPAAWALFVALLAALVARGAASADPMSQRPSRWPVIVGLLLAGGATDLFVRTVMRLVTDRPVDGSLLNSATLVTAAVVAGSWVGGRWLTARIHDAVERSLPQGNVAPVGHALLVGGCLVTVTVGLAQWGSPAADVQSAALGLAVVAYTATALLHYQRLRRAALVAGWGRTNRIVRPAVISNWTTWVFLLLVGALALAAVWWIPPAEPVRRTAEQASPEAVTRLQDYIDRHRMTREDLARPGSVAGESMPTGSASPPDEDRTVVRVRDLVEWLLQPATEFAEGEPPPDEGAPFRLGLTPQLIIAAVVLLGLLVAAYAWIRRTTGQPPLRVLAAWWARLWAVLAAMFRRGPSQAPSNPDGDDRPVTGAVESPRKARRWRRPANPRDQVKYDYFRVLDRAERHGLPRRPAQSVAEYAQVLRAAAPDHPGVVDDLTHRFIEARYSHHPIDSRIADQTRQASRALRRALKDAEPAESAAGRVET